MVATDKESLCSHGAPSLRSIERTLIASVTFSIVSVPEDDETIIMLVLSAQNFGFVFVVM